MEKQRVASHCVERDRIRVVSLLIGKRSSLMGTGYQAGATAVFVNVIQID